MNSTGPWERLNTDVKIVELSISEESNACSVWAVACNGSVLYRTNVNKENVKVYNVHFVVMKKSGISRIK